MILDIYKDSFEYSFKKPKTLLKIGILAVLTYFIIPIFLINGYNYKVLKVSVNGMINGDDEFPIFNDLISLFVDGVQVSIVHILYFLPVSLIILLDIFFIRSIAFKVPLLLLIEFIFVFFTLIYCVMGIANMAAYNGSFKAAFDFRRINKILKNIGFGSYILAYAGILILEFSFILVFFTIIFLISGFFGWAGSTVNISFFPISFALGFIFAFILCLFVLIPFLGIFRNRSLGLIYTVGDYDE